MNKIDILVKKISALTITAVIVTAIVFYYNVTIDEVGFMVCGIAISLLFYMICKIVNLIFSKDEEAKNG